MVPTMSPSCSINRSPSASLASHLCFLLILGFAIHSANASHMPSMAGPGATALQPDVRQQAPTLAEALTPFGTSAVVDTIFPPEVLSWQTPVQNHHFQVLSIPSHEFYAACHPVALSFFGKKDRLPSRICVNETTSAITRILTVYYTSYLTFPTQSVLLRKFLLDAGLDLSVSYPYDPSKPASLKPQNWAKWKAERIAKYLLNDGWNLKGRAGRDFKNSPVFGSIPRTYADTTGYRPRNPAHLSPARLRFPLRWQPLTQQVDYHGDYASQVAITPHIGNTVRPQSMSPSQWYRLRAKSPYKYPNKKGSISWVDRQHLLKNYIPRMLRMSRLLNPALPNARNLLFRAHWWDNKFSSLGSFGVAYSINNGLPVAQEFFRTVIGESIALHDATLLAWREKRRNDVARPVTFLRRLLRGRGVRAYEAVSNSIRWIPIDLWQPAVKTMPHSEFPSGSAVLCKAFLEFVKLRMEYTLNGNFTDNGVVLPIPENAFPTYPVTGGVTVTYKSLDEAAEDCGRSREHAGLHFKPAVDEGLILGEVVGRKSFETWRDLEEGRVPKHCHWCDKI